MQDRSALFSQFAPAINLVRAFGDDVQFFESAVCVRATARADNRFPAKLTSLVCQDENFRGMALCAGASDCHCYAAFHFHSLRGGDALR